jgi:hypothetical protein
MVKSEYNKTFKMFMICPRLLAMVIGIVIKKFTIPKIGNVQI